MADEPSAFLQKRLTELEHENASLKAENADRRTKGSRAGKELEAIKAQLATLTTERDTLKVKAEAGPKELTAKVAELEGTLRSRDHRDAFAAVKEFDGPDGKKYTLHPRATTEAVWTQLGYKPEGETPSGEVVAKTYAGALQSHPYLFAEATAPGGATRPIAVHAREGGPGAGKGSEHATVTAAAGGKGAAGNGSAMPGYSAPGRF